MTKHYIYVCGPYSQGDPVINVRRAVEIADILWAFGYVPFVPHLSHFWHMIAPKPYAEWLAYDNEWLRKCDAVLRIPGPSHGADAEVALAKELGIPVFHSIEELDDVLRVGVQE